jgi:hypothetical protein
LSFELHDENGVFRFPALTYPRLSACLLDAPTGRNVIAQGNALGNARTE